MTTEWVNGHAVAAHLGKSYGRVLEMAHAGAIPGHKLGGRWFFDLEEIDTSIKQLKDPWKQSARSRGRKRSLA